MQNLPWSSSSPGFDASNLRALNFHTTNWIPGTHRHSTRQDCNLFQSGFLTPGAKLCKSMLPLIVSGVPVEGIQHTPFRVRVHGDPGQQPQGEEEGNAINIVER